MKVVGNNSKEIKENILIYLLLMLFNLINVHVYHFKPKEVIICHSSRCKINYKLIYQQHKGSGPLSEELIGSNNSPELEDERINKQPKEQEEHVRFITDFIIFCFIISYFRNINPDVVPKVWLCFANYVRIINNMLFSSGWATGEGLLLK